MITAISDPASLETLIEQVMLSRRVSRADRDQLMQAFLTNALSEADMILVDRLFYGVRRGLLQLAE